MTGLFRRISLRIPGDPTSYVAEYANLDVDGDGDKDIILFYSLFPVQNVGTSLKVLLNDGSGNFSNGTNLIFPDGVPTTVHPRGTLVRDFNGDGRADVFLADHGFDALPYPGAQNLLFLSSGSNRLINSTNRLPTLSDFTHSTTAADIDNDGDLDILVTNIYGGLPATGALTQPYILLNDSVGNFVRTDDYLPVDVEARNFGGKYISSLFFDADNDGDVDLFLGNQGGETSLNFSRLYMNPGNGNFSSAAFVELTADPWGPSSAGAVSVQNGDLNGDGFQDLVVNIQNNYQGHYIQVLMNNGRGGFQDETRTRLPQLVMNDGRWVYSLALVDFNGDGFLDILSRNGQFPPIYLNDGTGKFINLPGNFLDLDGFATPWNVNLIPIDANNDGRLDILADLGGGSMFVFQQLDLGITQVGTALADGLLGDSDAETLSGLDGDDIIFGGAGKDTLLGGQGVDYLNGGVGDDTLNGGVGGDSLNGGVGSDFASYLDATTGVTAFLGGPQLNTGEAVGDTYNDIENLIGSAFADILGGTDDANLVMAGVGNDAIYGAGGRDTLEGGLGADFLDGQAGFDFASYANAVSGLTLFMGGGTFNTGEANGDTHISIEGLIGSQFSDIIGGDAGINELQGLGGNDFVYGRAGIDILLGGDGNDVLSGGLDGDRLDGGAGIDVAFYRDATVGLTASLLTGGTTGEASGDTYLNIENIWGSDFDDVLTGDNDGGQVYGFAGNDQLSGLDGDDFFYGSVGLDTMTGGSGVDNFFFLSWNDHFNQFGTLEAYEGGDTFTDFTVGTDRIILSRYWFGFGNIQGPAAALTDTHANFVTNGTPTSARPSLIWNAGNRTLSFDADGNGATQAVLLGTFQAGAALTLNDIWTA